MAIGIDVTAPDNSAVDIMAKNVKSGIYHTSTGVFALTHINDKGTSTVRFFYGQQAADLFNALVSIKAGTYTSTT
jgi:hypothetical protein